MHLTLRYFEILLSLKQCKVAGTLKWTILDEFLLSSYQPVIIAKKVVNIPQKNYCMHEISLIGKIQGEGETETSVAVE